MLTRFSLASLASLAVAVSGCEGSSSGGSGTGHDAAPADAADPCAAIIGHWLATLDQGAMVKVLGQNLPLAGTIDFMLTHDDADLPDIVDFNGTATIMVSGQTVTQVLAPATSPSGDPQDSTCDGGLHLKGQARPQAGQVRPAASAAAASSSP